MKLSIAYINDVHGYLEPHPELFYEGGKEIITTSGGYSRIATVLKDLRKKNPNTLVFDGGDTFHGTLPLIQSKGEAVIPVLNKMGLSAMVGHWDFAYGPEQLKKLAGQLNYPILGINVYKDDGSLFLPPYIITDVEGLKIAVIGICSNIIDKTMPEHFSEGLKITDGTEELPVMVQRVKAEGAQLIILLSHNGFPQDAELLSKVSGIDVCLSAHTHNRLYEAVKINNTVVIQCGCHGSFVGRLDLNVEQQTIVDYGYQLITVNEDIDPDIEMENTVSQIMQPFQHLKQEILGTTGNVLHRYNTLSSTMDDLLLASIKSVSKADVAFSNGWRYGVPIPKGPITKWDLFNIIPMNPEVSTLDLTGGEIIRMLEENLERTFSADPMKQMGGYIKRCLGISVKMRIENPKRHRIQQIFVGDGVLAKDQVYKAAFVTVQGVPEGLGINRLNLPLKAVEAMEMYLSENKIGKTGDLQTFSLV
ncbi:bifunctional metallophosphatase/5'-nucleotidase [Chryseobacterium sp.]|uniref:bifunctional metallophosphatase/5'-nucleotidase n=1 Tax=Chryseobacterium sp. TaxID=1871047 RepID=UPI0011C776F9|nr:5'-nucleotidase C-terminal domain-containing protein [Chryseobacterium sp.]TXF74810.1 bifunctional metallophosphatase/5'-nucleotidase [Chryseobacterium sp.]